MRHAKKIDKKQTYRNMNKEKHYAFLKFLPSVSYILKFQKVIISIYKLFNKICQLYEIITANIGIFLLEVVGHMDTQWVVASG